MPQGNDSTDDLQFATPEPMDENAPRASIPTRKCAACGRPITATYFAFRDKVICPNCAAQVNAPPAGSKAGRLFKAGIMGLGAGLVGALIWFAIRRIAHVEIGLVAVLVGFMVGKAVRKGSGNRGGRGYQVMAVVLTYCCIAANYMPDVIEAAMSHYHSHHKTAVVQPAATPATTTASVDPDTGEAINAPAPVVHSTTPATHKKPNLITAIIAIVALLAVAFGISLAAPIMAGAGNVLGLVIIAFALWEAWKFNRPQSLAITGPYQVGSPGAIV